MNHAHFTLEVVPGNDPVIKLCLAGSIDDADETAALKLWAESVRARIREVYNSTNKKVPVLVDLSGLENNSEGDAITTLSDLMKADTAFVRKTATFGANKKIKLALAVTETLAGRALRSFATEDLALAWLRSAMAA